MAWSQLEIENHLKACELLNQVKNSAFEFIRDNPNTDEYEVQQFIHKLFKKNNLVALEPHNRMIVAFDKSSSNPHYIPAKENSKKLKPNTLILIDIWARLNKKKAPFSDITWIAYYGKEIPEEIKKVWDTVRNARNCSLEFISERLKKGIFPTGKQIDDIAVKIISNASYRDNILHNTGHSIGFNSPHGKENGLSQKNNDPIVIGLGYTNEPGIYMKGKFGIRSEIDFYIDKNNKIIITTPIQEEIFLITF